MSKAVIVIGAGIVGCATAFFLSEAGAEVVVYDAEGIGAGASGRNAGLIEHPYDLVQEALYEETISLLSEMEESPLPHVPIGVLLLASDEHEAICISERFRSFPSLAPVVLSPEALQVAEPQLSHTGHACLLRTGYPVDPASLTRHFARAARNAGASFELGTPALLERDSDGDVCGIRTGAGVRRSDAIVVAAGVHSASLIDPSHRWRPIWPLWGVSVSADAISPPTHAILDGRISAVQAGGAPLDLAFSLIPAPHRLALGSTFLAEKPDAKLWVQRLTSTGERYWPALKAVRDPNVLVCARPRSFDGRPLLGRVDGEQRLWLAAGHGGRGVSTGPASARLVAHAVLAGTDDHIPLELRADRTRAER